MTAWFLILLFTGFWTGLTLIEYVSSLENQLINISRGDILFSIFFVFFAKSAAEVVENTLRNKTLKHLVTSPASFKKIEFSRLLKVFWYNMLLFAISMSIIALITPLFNITLPIDLYFFPHLYLSIAVSIIMGFNIAVFSHLPKVRYKIATLLLYGQYILLTWKVMHSNVSDIGLLIYLTLLGTLSLLILVCSSKLFIQSWKHGVTTSTASPLRFHTAGDFLPKIIAPPIRRVAEKEIIIRWRRRESPASVSMVTVISGALIFLFYQLGPKPDFGLGFGKYFYPILIGMSLYLAVVLVTVLPSLTLFSREGKRLWAQKTLPISSEDVVWGKLFSMLFYSPLIPILIAIPLPILLDFPIYFLFFAVASSFAMIFSFSGIGVWAAVRFPNFDESVDGAPDVITMYIILITCLFAGALLTGYPLQILERDYFLGLLAMIYSADIAAFMMVILVKRSSVHYENLELDM